MARATIQPRESPAQLQTAPNGGAAAALLAAGIGCLALGVLSVLTGVFDPLSQLLKFYGLADDISGVSTLRKDRQAYSQQQTDLDFSPQRLTEPAIDRQLVLQQKRGCGGIFDHPELTPTGARDDRSGVCIPATQHDPVIPAHAKARLDQTIEGKLGNILFCEDALGEQKALLLLRRRCPDLKAISCRIGQETGCHVRTARPLDTDKHKACRHPGSPYRDSISDVRAKCKGKATRECMLKDSGTLAR